VFDIEEDGSVTNIRVIQAFSANLFEKYAVAAVSKWKFRPKIIDGNSVKQTNKTYVIDFNLH